jgi:hypothetical protein
LDKELHLLMSFFQLPIQTGPLPADTSSFAGHYRRGKHLRDTFVSTRTPQRQHHLAARFFYMCTAATMRTNRNVRRNIEGLEPTRASIGPRWP